MDEIPSEGGSAALRPKKTHAEAEQKASEQTTKQAPPSVDEAPLPGPWKTGLAPHEPLARPVPPKAPAAESASARTERSAACRGAQRRPTRCAQPEAAHPRPARRWLLGRPMWPSFWPAEAEPSAAGSSLKVSSSAQGFISTSQ